MDIFDKDTQEYLINAGRPVLLVGEHGVGKTSVLRSISSNFNMKMHELNAATLDPFVHIVGIPVTSEGKVEMNPPEELQDAEILFIDELNRADRQTRNALFEIICDHSVNGKKLPNLKLVVAAMNPPDSTYHVDELDKAMDDRFLFRFKVERDISHALALVKDEEKQAAIKKWYSALEEPPSPRRLTWVIEAVMDEKGEINEPAILNALDDNLYATSTLLQMLKDPSSLEKLNQDLLLTPDEQQLISNIIYSALSTARDGNNKIEKKDLDRIRELYIGKDGTTVLPAPDGVLGETHRDLLSSSEAVRELNDMFNFPFNLITPEGKFNNEWLNDTIRSM